jgi:hypothetical protein
MTREHMQEVASERLESPVCAGHGHDDGAGLLVKTAQQKCARGGRGRADRHGLLSRAPVKSVRVEKKPMSFLKARKSKTTCSMEIR